MIIELSRVEMAVLSVNMAALRKNVRKGFKSNFGKQEGQEKLEVYDEIKAALNDGIEKTDEEQKRELHFNKYEIDMLNDFVPILIFLSTPKAFALCQCMHSQGNKIKP